MKVCREHGIANLSAAWNALDDDRPQSAGKNGGLSRPKDRSSDGTSGHDAIPPETHMHCRHYSCERLIMG